MKRRSVLKTSLLGALGFSLTGMTEASNYVTYHPTLQETSQKPGISFPYIDPEIVSEVVGKSHSNLEGVKKLVDARPELARSCWEWRFGDFESAIGAASHVGRRDITLYLLSKGARPSIFTYAMLGSYEVVKSMVESTPGIQRTMGPHGISLLSHAYAGVRMKSSMSQHQIDQLKRTTDFLESLGDAGGEKYIEVSADEQKKYLGDYMYGDQPNQGLSITLNMRKLMSLGEIGKFGGALYKIAENKFIYNGSPSVNISFDIENDIVKSMTIKEPNFSLTAIKVK